MKKSNLSLYGNITLERGRCPGCGSDAFIMRGRYQCCDYPADVKAVKYERMSEPFQQLNVLKTNLTGLATQQTECAQHLKDIEIKGKQNTDAANQLIITMTGSTEIKANEWLPLIS